MKGLNTQMQIQFLNQQDKMEVDLYEEDLRKILEGTLAYANFEIEVREYLPSVNVVYFNHDSMKQDKKMRLQMSCPFRCWKCMRVNQLKQ